MGSTCCAPRIGADELDTSGVISAYKDLAGVERDFRSMKAIDIDIRPVHHRLEDRVRAHAFLCFLATYVTFHLRATLAPLTFTDPSPKYEKTPSPLLCARSPRGTRPRRRTTPEGNRSGPIPSSSSTSVL